MGHSVKFLEPSSCLFMAPDLILLLKQSGQNLWAVCPLSIVSGDGVHFLSIPNLTYIHIYTQTYLSGHVCVHTHMCTYIYTPRCPSCDLPGEQPSPRLRVSVPAPEPGGGVLLLWGADPGCPLGERSTRGLFCMVKWDPPLSAAAVGAGGGMEESIREGCFHFMFNFLQTELCLPLHPQPPRVFWGGGGTRGTKIYSSIPSSLWGWGRDKGSCPAAAVEVLCLWVPGPFCGGDREVGVVTGGWETEDPRKAGRDPEHKVVSGKQTWN